MKVRMPSIAMQDVGELTHVHALPTASRIRRGMKTACAVCGKPIVNAFFYAGFAPGQPNRIFHYACLDELSQAIVKYPDCQKCGQACNEDDSHLLNGNFIHVRCDVSAKELCKCGHPKMDHPEDNRVGDGFCINCRCNYYQGGGV